MIIVYLILCGLIAFGDIRFRHIPDKMTFSGILIGLTFNAFQHQFFFGLFGMLMGAGSIFVAAMLCFFISKKPAMGGGDLKLLAMIGAFWGPEVVLWTFAISPFVGSLWAGILNKNKMAYGVFLIIVSLIVLSFRRIYGY